jgi:hypothetical protein
MDMLFNFCFTNFCKALKFRKTRLFWLRVCSKYSIPMGHTVSNLAGSIEIKQRIANMPRLTIEQLSVGLHRICKG